MYIEKISKSIKCDASGCPNLSDIYVGWNGSTEVNGTGNKWGAPPDATIHYDTKFNG